MFTVAKWHHLRTLYNTSFPRGCWSDVNIKKDAHLLPQLFFEIFIEPDLGVVEVLSEQLMILNLTLGLDSLLDDVIGVKKNISSLHIFFVVIHEFAPGFGLAVSAFVFLSLRRSPHSLVCRYYWHLLFFLFRRG